MFRGSLDTIFRLAFKLSVFNTHHSTHCPTVMSTQPVRYSGYYDWFILLWPRHDHFSSWIKIKGVPFWKSNQFVVTQLNLQIIYDGQILIFGHRSKVLSIKLWPKLKFWHWSPWCRVPVSISIAQFLVTCQIYGLFEGATLYLFFKNPRLGDNNCDQNWNFGTGLVAFKRLLWIILNYPWWLVNQIGWTNIQSNKIIFNLFN